MAIDWNKEISFNDVFKRSEKAGGSKYPSKTTMNLYVVERTTKMSNLVLIAVLLVLIVVFFVKFGVIDQYARLNAKEAELSQQQIAVSQVEAQLANYDEVLATYQGFASTGDPNAVDAISVLDLVTSQVMPYANVSSIALNDGVLTLTVTGTSLSTVGELATSLTGQDMVESVSVSTASNSTKTTPGDTATITIQLSNGDAATISSAATSTSSSSSSSISSSTGSSSSATNKR